jgi:hypothetical protein
MNNINFFRIIGNCSIVGGIIMPNILEIEIDSTQKARIPQSDAMNLAILSAMKSI